MYIYTRKLSLQIYAVKYVEHASYIIFTIASWVFKVHLRQCAGWYQSVKKKKKGYQAVCVRWVWSYFQKVDYVLAYLVEV